MAVEYSKSAISTDRDSLEMSWHNFIVRYSFFVFCLFSIRFIMNKLVGYFNKKGLFPGNKTKQLSLTWKNTRLICLVMYRI